MVEHSHVGIGVVEVVGVGWVVFFCPVGRKRTVKIENVVLGFRLIVHAVETDHLAGKKKYGQGISLFQSHSLDFLWLGTHMVQEEV